MDQNPTHTRIAFNKDHSVIFLAYLNEICDHFDQYLKFLSDHKVIQRIYLFNLRKVRENLMKVMFTASLQGKKKHNIKITEAERLTIFELINRFPLPNGIEFIQYEITKNLLL